MQPAYMSASDITAQSVFFKRRLANFTNVPLVPLYHYTTGPALIEIIKSGTLLNTQASCLNDTKELLYAVDLFRDRLHARITANSLASLDVLHEALDQNSKMTGVEDVGVFVTSFSKMPDDLSQWRAYGSADGAYKIEFDSQLLRVGSAATSGTLLPIEYIIGNQIALVDDALKHIEAHFYQGATIGAPTAEQWADEVARWWLWHLSFLSPLLKDPAFSSEGGWRLIRWLEDADRAKMVFFRRRTMMTRHIPISFSNPIAIKGLEKPYAPLPIKSVTIGPTYHPEVSKISVGDLLISRGYNVKVHLTQILYRSHD